MRLRKWRRTLAGYGLAIATVAVTGCGGGTSVEKLTEARRLSALLLVEFTKAADAANRAVMANTDTESVAFARESTEAADDVRRNAEPLAMLLVSLRYADESKLLGEFTSRFADYQALDRTILELAVENSNLKAQRLSFGPMQKEADAFRDSLASIERSAAPVEVWRVKALVATAVSAVREIQVLQAPHIAEPDDEAMNRIEKQMAASEADARSALEMVDRARPSSKAHIAAARAALDRFMDLNAQLITLSRRNTNVRSLALSLGRKRMLTAGCEESLRALQDGLAKRGFPGSR